MDFSKLTIESLLKGYRAKEFKPSEVAAFYLGEIEKKNKSLNAYLQIKPEVTKKRAEELDKKIANAAELPLFGVPIAVKDNFLISGWQCTAGSKILEGYTSPYTGTAMERLEAAGAIVVGKTNCDEFAMGSSNENSAYGPCKNPWDLSRVPGGSSGGSAAAVAANTAIASLGTDTGGSIRQPASLCGLVGLKPSYGRVSRYGIVAYASSLDQVGPFTKTVWDSAKLLEIMGGLDPKDTTTSGSAVPPFTSQLSQTLANPGKFRVGIASDWLQGLEGDVKKSFDAAVDTLKKLGGEIVPVSLKHTKYALSVYYLIAPSECSSNLARYDGVHYGHRASKTATIDELYCRSRGEGIGNEVKLRIMLGTYALSAGYYDAFYIKANQVRKLLQNDFDEAFKTVDCIAVPTSPTTAFKIGEKTDDPIKMYLSDIYTLPINLAGLPGISVPCGLDSKNLPIGLQLIGRRFDESTLFKIASAYETARGPFELPSWKGDS